MRTLVPPPSSFVPGHDRSFPPELSRISARGSIPGLITPAFGADYYPRGEPQLKNLRGIWITPHARTLFLQGGVSVYSGIRMALYLTSWRSGVAWQEVLPQHAGTLIYVDEPAVVNQWSVRFQTIPGLASDNIAAKPYHPMMVLGYKTKRNHPNVGIRGKPFGLTTMLRETIKGLSMRWGWPYNYNGLNDANSYLEMNMSYAVTRENNWGWGACPLGDWLERWFGDGWLGVNRLVA